jgi:hypothetical protein
MLTRRNDEIYLIGIRNSESISRLNQLPTIRQVLQRFHYFLHANKSIRNSSHLTVEELILVWSKAAIPMRLVKHIVDMIEKVHSKWLLLKKNKGRSSKSQKNREQIFVNELNNIFDISHANALAQMRNQTDLDFLYDQRHDRKMFMTSIDKKLENKQQRALQRKIEEEKRRQKAVEATASTSLVRQIKYTEDETDEDLSCSDNDVEFEPFHVKQKAKLENKEEIITKNIKTNLFNSHVTGALDRNKISDRQALRLMVPLTVALGHNPSSLSISRSTIQRRRKEARKEHAINTKNTFTPKYPLVVHWDGKILPFVVGHGKVERLPVLVSGDGEEKLLGVPKLEAGTGQNVADAVYDLLFEWNVLDNVKALGFDTTSVNTGKFKGACTLLEQKIGHDMLWLACRHHTMEIILAKIFCLCFGASNSPDIPMFKSFKTIWRDISKDKYLGLNLKEETETFVGTTLSTLKYFLTENKSPRDDYLELCELVLIVLNKPPSKIHWRAPGPIHHARWMSKLIYAIKIFLFRKQNSIFNLTKREETQLQRFVLFGALLYTKVWIEAPLAAEAPRNDLNFWLNLKKYEAIDSEISIAARMVLERHLWYLSDELVGLALFSTEVTSIEKSEIVIGMEKETDKRQIRGNTSLLKNNVNLGMFATKRSLKLLTILEIKDSFLNLPPEEWPQNEEYQQGRDRIKQLRVVNDTAERGVKLFEEYNKLLTYDEEEKQFLLQVIEANRKTVPTETTKKMAIEAVFSSESS